MTLPTRYAEACERAADTLAMHALDVLAEQDERAQDRADAALLCVLAQALREGDDVTDEDCGTPLLYLLITLPTEPGA